MRTRISYPWMAGLCLLLLAGCKKDKREEFFQIHDHVEFTISPGLNTFDTHFWTIGPKLSLLEAQLDASGRTRDEVKAIEPRSAYLSSIFEDINLDFIDRISIYIYDPFNPDDKIEFLYLDPVPAKNKVGIQLFPGIADISDWVDREYYGVEVRLNFRQVTPSAIQMRLNFDLRVLGE